MCELNHISAKHVGGTMTLLILLRLLRHRGKNAGKHAHVIYEHPPHTLSSECCSTNPEFLPLLMVNWWATAQKLWIYWQNLTRKVNVNFFCSSLFQINFNFPTKPTNSFFHQFHSLWSCLLVFSRISVTGQARLVSEGQAAPPHIDKTASRQVKIKAEKTNRYRIHQNTAGEKSKRDIVTQIYIEVQ